MDISVAKQPESITPMIPVGNAVKIKVGRIASVVPWVATISGSSTRPAKAICTSARQKKKQIIVNLMQKELQAVFQCMLLIAVN